MVGNQSTFKIFNHNFKLSGGRGEGQQSADCRVFVFAKATGVVVQGRLAANDP